MYCQYCELERPSKERFCKTCGASLIERPEKVLSAEFAKQRFLVDNVERWKASGKLSAELADELTADNRKQLEAHFGFDKPFHKRYVKWLITDRLGMRMESYKFPDKTAWQRWLRNNVHYSLATAERYMRVARFAKNIVNVDDFFDLDPSVLYRVAALPDDCREAFMLTQLDGYTYDEAAAIENASRGTIASRVIRARQIHENGF